MACLPVDDTFVGCEGVCATYGQQVQLIPMAANAAAGVHALPGGCGPVVPMPAVVQLAMAPTPAPAVQVDGLASFAAMQTYAQGPMVAALPMGALGAAPPAMLQQPKADPLPLILSTSPLGKKPQARRDCDGAAQQRARRQQQQQQQQQELQQRRRQSPAACASGSAAADQLAAPAEHQSDEADAAAPQQQQQQDAPTLPTLPADSCEASPSSAWGGRGAPDASPVSVRNTFVDFPVKRSPSLDSFFEERMVRSSPASRAQSPMGSREGVQLNLFGMDPEATPGDAESDAETPGAAEDHDQQPEPAHAGEDTAPVVRHQPLHQQQFGGRAVGQSPVVLRLADVIEKLGPLCKGSDADVASTAAGSSAIPSSLPSGPGSAVVPQQDGMLPGAVPDGLVLGSPELPSKGSALHRWGACKPCAFVFSEGCMNAVDCQFCHLCEPGEKRRRRKERRRLAAQAELAQSVPR